MYGMTENEKHTVQTSTLHEEVDAGLVGESAPYAQAPALMQITSQNNMSHLDITTSTEKGEVNGKQPQHREQSQTGVLTGARLYLVFVALMLCVFVSTDWISMLTLCRLEITNHTRPSYRCLRWVGSDQTRWELHPLISWQINPLYLLLYLFLCPTSMRESKLSFFPFSLPIPIQLSLTPLSFNQVAWVITGYFCTCARILSKGHSLPLATLSDPMWFYSSCRTSTHRPQGEMDAPWCNLFLWARQPYLRCGQGYEHINRWACYPGYRCVAWNLGLESLLMLSPGASGMFVSILAVIAVVTRVDQRAAFMASFGFVFVISSVVGPLLGGAFTDNVTWRWALWSNSERSRLPHSAQMVFLHQSFLRGLCCCRCRLPSACSGSRTRRNCSRSHSLWQTQTFGLARYESHLLRHHMPFAGSCMGWKPIRVEQ